MNNKTLILTTALTISSLSLVGCSPIKITGCSKTKIIVGAEVTGTKGNLEYWREKNCPAGIPTNTMPETSINTETETPINTTTEILANTGAETPINTTTEISANTEASSSNLSEFKFIPTKGNMSVGYVY